MTEYSLWGIVIIQGISIIVLGISAWRESDARRGLEGDLLALRNNVEYLKELADEMPMRDRLLDIYAVVNAARERGASLEDILITAGAAFDINRRFTKAPGGGTGA